MTEQTPSDHYPPPDEDGPAVVHGVDTRRVPHEIRWAVEADGDLLLDQLDQVATVVAVDEDGEQVLLVKTVAGDVIGVIPAWRLSDIDWSLVAAHIASNASDSLTDASEALETLTERPWLVAAPPDQDYIVFDLGPRYMVVHRRHGVADWPESDRRYVARDFDGVFNDEPSE